MKAYGANITKTISIFQRVNGDVVFTNFVTGKRDGHFISLSVCLCLSLCCCVTLSQTKLSNVTEDVSTVIPTHKRFGS